MLQFKDFLKENILTESEEDLDLLSEEAKPTKVSNDDKGKLHELLLAKYLHPNGQLPDHHRSESANLDHAGTPEQVHSRLANKIGGAAYNEIDNHARQTAEQIKKQLQADGHIDNDNRISHTFWTSNRDTADKAGDHEKTTGVKDLNSNADLILRITDKKGNVKHIGVSAKYGSQKPNYRNAGVDSMEKTAGLEKGTLTTHMDNHKKAMDELGHHGSADERTSQTKVDEMGLDAARELVAKHEKTLAGGGTLDKKERLMHQSAKAFVDGHDSLPQSERRAYLTHATGRAEEARRSSLDSRTKMARDFESGMKPKSSEELEKYVTDNVSPHTHIPHYVAHSKTRPDGSAESEVKPMHKIASEHLSQFEPGSLYVADGNSISTVIKGRSKKTGKPQNVATATMKNSSGVHKGVAGTFGLK